MKEETITKPSVKEFDGYIDIVSPNIDGTYNTVREKFYLSDSEVAEFMGDHDPMLYWRLGRVPVMYKKEFGNLLGDDTLEKQTCDKVFKKFPGILLFRHPYQSLYTLLIPKEFSSLEKNGRLDYENRVIFCDSRSIVFGASEGGSFTEKNFTRKAKLILQNLVRTNADDYLEDAI